MKLFEFDEPWKEHWRGMPEFIQPDAHPWRSIEVGFRTVEDFARFQEVIGQRFKNGTKYTPAIWFPYAGPFASRIGKYYSSSSPKNPRHPIYVISKGRWESRLTVRYLEKMNVPYKIVVEPQERDAYANVIDPTKILVLPFSNLGLGSIPARNWVWEHALANGATWHWILDDNIAGFFRMNRNTKIAVHDGTIFWAAEEFVERYQNVAQAGFQYWMFAPHRARKPAFVTNTRVYSCMLIRNDLPYRWRGRYNEDTDLSLQMLKGGWCTVLFYAFIADKMTTLTMKGGNTDELYAGAEAGRSSWETHIAACRFCLEDTSRLCDSGRAILSTDGRWRMADALRSQHPDVTRVTRKWGRWQHHVDYSRFANNALIVRPDVSVKDGIDDFGMKLHVDNSPMK